ncbi:recombinase family protein [Mesorhizobium sp. L103C105A0]|uniref:recombinase family protein n=1 Tax=Mesorhizobium sp. L103C105A0 TaxID=1287074 RepID=UPI0003CFDFFB|nr:recombinase family protein [Mesorhizobium sp. L103C105A0]ESZ78375.1 resolvase [Mesorhizobium sp. L103C105A0]
MSRIGYARVSTVDQDLDTQIAKLKAEGCGIIRSEKVSGGSRDGRAELATIIDFLRPGDELLVTRLDRLGRDTRDVLNLIYECEQRDAFVTVLDPHVSTRGEMGHMVLTVLGMIAQMERRFIKERQREGIEKAKRERIYQGGKRRLDHTRILQLYSDGMGPAEIAKAIGCSRMHIYRILNKLKAAAR